MDFYEGLFSLCVGLILGSVLSKVKKKKRLKESKRKRVEGAPTDKVFSSHPSNSTLPSKAGERDLQEGFMHQTNGSAENPF